MKRPLKALNFCCLLLLLLAYMPSLSLAAEQPLKYHLGDTAAVQAIAAGSDDPAVRAWVSEPDPSKWFSGAEGQTVKWENAAKNEKTLRATELNLPSLNLKGKVDISSLSDLSKLDLSGNYAVSSLSDLSDNPELTIVNLANISLEDQRTLAGFEALKLIHDLNVSGCGLASIKLPPDNPLFQSLNVSGNPLKTLDLSANPHLIDVDVSNTFIKEINLSRQAELKRFSAFNTPVSNIDLSSNPQLSVLNLSHTQISVIDLNKAEHLAVLRIAETPLKSLNLDNCRSLSHLDLRGTTLTTLELANCPELTALFLSGNSIKSLNLASNSKLEHLSISELPLSGLDLSGNPGLKTLLLENTGLSEIDLRAQQKINTLKVTGEPSPVLKMSRTLQSLHTDQSDPVVFGPDFMGARLLYLHWQGRAADLPEWKQDPLTYILAQRYGLEERDKAMASVSQPLGSIAAPLLKPNQAYKIEDLSPHLAAIFHSAHGRNSETVLTLTDENSENHFTWSSPEAAIVLPVGLYTIHIGTPETGLSFADVVKVGYSVP